jgi:sulfate/thiosulfate transport system permease protein
VNDAEAARCHPAIRATLIGAALVFLAGFLFLPLAIVVREALRGGPGAYLAALAEPNARAALRLTLLVAVLVVPANAVFGLAAAWALAKFRFRGRTLLTTLVDLPFSVSPVVTGLLFVVLFGRTGWLEPWLSRHGLRILFALPAIVLVTLFVTLPFVARELIPLMEAQGIEEEEAAVMLGAGGWRTFLRVTLPNVRWGLAYGLILTTARSMGEFGAVSVVSGHIRGLTTTLPLEVEMLHQEFHTQAAFAVASALTLIAVLTLVARGILPGATTGDRGERFG